jgi:YD repeat-containing protein
LFGYDNLGRLTLLSGHEHQLNFGYDALGRLVSESDSHGTRGSQYDAAGRRTRFTYPDGLFLDYSYLQTGELSSVRENGASWLLASFGHDQMGRRTSIGRPSGANTNYVYDNAGRLASLGHDFPDNSYDVTLTFGYNPAGQISSRTNSNDLYAYTLLSSGSVAASHDGLNRVVEAGGPVTHDARGNLTSEGGRTFSYSSENLLTGLTALGRSWTLTYDPMLRLQHTTTSGFTSRTYAYDGDNPLVTLREGLFLARNVFGPGASEPLCLAGANDLYSYGSIASGTAASSVDRLNPLGRVRTRAADAGFVSRAFSFAAASWGARLDGSQDDAALGDCGSGGGGDGRGGAGGGADRGAAGLRAGGKRQPVPAGQPDARAGAGPGGAGSARADRGGARQRRFGRA